MDSQGRCSFIIFGLVDPYGRSEQPGAMHIFDLMPGGEFRLLDWDDFKPVVRPRSRRLYQLYLLVGSLATAGFLQSVAFAIGLYTQMVLFLKHLARMLFFAHFSESSSEESGSPLFWVHVEPPVPLFYSHSRIYQPNWIPPRRALLQG